MAILLEVIYRVDAISINIPTQFFTDLKRKISNFVWKNKKLKIAKTILYNQGNSRAITISDIKLYYRATLMKTAGLGINTDRLTAVIELDTDIYPHTYECVIFGKIS